MKKIIIGIVFFAVILIIYWLMHVEAKTEWNPEIVFYNKESMIKYYNNLTDKKDKDRFRNYALNESVKEIKQKFTENYKNYSPTNNIIVNKDKIIYNNEIAENMYSAIRNVSETEMLHRINILQNDLCNSGAKVFIDLDAGIEVNYFYIGKKIISFELNKEKCQGNDVAVPF